jgi:hypothetical protein
MVLNLVKSQESRVKSQESRVKGQSFFFDYGLWTFDFGLHYVVDKGQTTNQYTELDKSDYWLLR